MPLKIRSIFGQGVTPLRLCIDAKERPESHPCDPGHPLIFTHTVLTPEDVTLSHTIPCYPLSMLLLNCYLPRLNRFRLRQSKIKNAVFGSGVDVFTVDFNI
jgi:hypothetical protein